MLSKRLAVGENQESFRSYALASEDCVEEPVTANRQLSEYRPWLKRAMGIFLWVL
jgi:hypothetical protein